MNLWFLADTWWQAPNQTAAAACAWIFAICALIVWLGRGAAEDGGAPALVILAIIGLVAFGLMVYFAN